MRPRSHVNLIIKETMRRIGLMLYLTGRIAEMARRRISGTDGNGIDMARAIPRIWELRAYLTSLNGGGPGVWSRKRPPPGVTG